MDAFTKTLLVLIATSCLWLISATKLAPAKPLVQRTTPQPTYAVLQVSCVERERICNARKRLDRIKAKGIQ